MTNDGSVTLHHRLDGDPTAPTVVLGSSLGTTLGMWDQQIEALTEHWQVVRFDTRGHGGSPVPDGPYAVAELADDVVRLLDGLGVDQFGYVGLSLGGAIGQQLAVGVPDRVRSLVLCCTAARFNDPENWLERAERVRAEGTGWLAETTAARWFTTPFREREPQQVDRLLTMLRDTPAEGYASCCEALATVDLRDRLGDVKAPTLVIAGEEDPATPPDLAEVLAGGIVDADLLVVPGAAHIANVESPEAVTPAIVEHLTRTCP